MLRVGIVGCGNVALGFHVPAYQALRDRFEVVALADPTPGRLELGRAGTGLGEEQVHLDPQALLSRDDVDLVDVCTPQHLHRDMVVAAAQAGKHVVCEKPLAAVPAEAADAVEAAERAGVHLGVVHNYLFFPEIVAAARVIESGEIGDVRVVIVNYLGVVDSPGAGGYRPQWRQDPSAAGGGVLMDMLHAVYLAERLLGAPIERVSAYASSGTPGDAVEDLALVRFEAHHRVALVNMAWGMGPGGVQVVGTKGRLSISYRDDGTPPWAPFERMVVTSGAGTHVEALPVGKQLRALVLDSMQAALVDIADAIGQRRRPAADGRQALHILESTLAAYTSAGLGRTVTLPLGAASPVFTRGVVGLRHVDLPEWSTVRRDGLFGIDEG